MNFLKSFYNWVTFGITNIVTDKQCAFCKSDKIVLDLQDGDYICKKCWDNYTPSIL